MPYIACPRCGVRTFTAAYWSNREHCGNCGTELPTPRSMTPLRTADPGHRPLAGRIVRSDRRPAE
ncbi:hypothetical protein [Conexibacter arvalis]|uniref:Uncharacterized protein n=1 Tax=Conexibacter arvalis TaxID=912552 RepID=A0A840ICW1_9ACTN|nr:hypothetical protein [Conexibacter arvalis]MBB4661904.1 hypothetical protein [Conexibacter arvalis]